MKTHCKGALKACSAPGFLCIALLFLIYPYRAAAQQNGQEPATSIGGTGGSVIDAEQLSRFQKMAETGNAFAQFKLGEAYLHGNIVPQDYAEAIQWFEKSAGQGNIDAQSELGSMYAEGKGIPQDTVLAYKWLSLSIMGLNGRESPTGKAAESRRNATAGGMTSEQLEEAELQVQAWKTDYLKKAVGGLVVPSWGVSMPVELVMPTPPYTDQARAARVEGSILLQCIVRKDGTVNGCRIIRSLGYGLDEESIRIIETKWRFKPAMILDKPIDMPVNLEIRFDIH
jgi:TonB family protein